MRNFLKNPRLQIMLVIGILTAGSFYVWWVSKYQPRQEEIVELTSREAELQAATAELRSILADINTERIRQSIDQYDQQLRQVTQLVPPDSFNVQMLPLVTQTAGQYNVQIQSINPIERQQQQGFVTDGAEINVRGQYHNVGAFMTALLNLEHITQIRDTNLQVARGNTGDGGGGQRGAGGRNRQNQRQQSSGTEGQGSGSALEALQQTRSVEVVFDFLLFKSPTDSNDQDQEGADNNQGQQNNQNNANGEGG